MRDRETYNERYLSTEDSSYIRGMEFVKDNAIESFFGNLDVYVSDGDIAGEDINIFRLLENHPKIAMVLESALKDWINMDMDMTIVAMIDMMSDAEYDKRKAEADNE